MCMTLSELCTLSNPNFLFVAKHVSTGFEVKLILKNTDDLSENKLRYNLFEIDGSEFNGGTYGLYSYSVYEQESETNTNPGNSTGLVELGLMSLIGESANQVKQRDTSVFFKVRQ